MVDNKGICALDLFLNCIDEAIEGNYKYLMIKSELSDGQQLNITIVRSKDFEEMREFVSKNADKNLYFEDVDLFYTEYDYGNTLDELEMKLL